MSRGLILGRSFYPLTHVPPRAGFVFAMAARFKQASGRALTADQCFELARSTYHFLLPMCGGRHFHPDYDWSLGAAIEWANADIEHWEAGDPA